MSTSPRSGSPRRSFFTARRCSTIHALPRPVTSSHRRTDRLGDPYNAAGEFVRAADLMPGDADAQVKAGVFLIAGGAFEDAKSRALKALEVNPRHVEAHLLLAQATARLKNLNGAIEQIEQALRSDPSEPLILSTLADFRLAQGDTKAAEAAFKQAVAADPKSVTASLGLGRFYLATGKAADAEEWLKKALALEPGNALANRSLAALYIRTNRLADAEAPLKASAQAAAGPEGETGPRRLLRRRESE